MSTSGEHGRGGLGALRRAVILPTRASVAVFRRTLEARVMGGGAGGFIPPELITRDEWIVRLHDALTDARPLLTLFERSILMERAARRAADRARMPGAPFEIRPGLVSEMLRFYDELRRRQRSVRRFSQVLFKELRVERGTDRGSEGLLHQTCFLAFAFLGYERGVAATGALDEHGLRQRLIETRASGPFDHLVVAVTDHPADSGGLWPADFDLLGRLAGPVAVDVVITDELHDAGFRLRVEEALPGIEEVRSDTGRSNQDVGGRPVIIRPADAPEASCWTHRDREEELRAVVRLIRTRASATDHALREPVAVVFQRPLPYLYLARDVFADAKVPFQTFDALPLASEPAAGLLDQVLEVARTGGTRETMIALLRSPLLRLEVAGAQVSADDAAMLDRVLSERRATADGDGMRREVGAHVVTRALREREADAAFRAAEAAANVTGALRAYREGSAASVQLISLATFLRAHLAPLGEDDNVRHHRARAAVLALLDGLADACRQHDDRPRPPDTLAAAVRHWIERQTFSPSRDGGGAWLLDAVAARFGEFEHVHLVGLVENEWPERPRRSIFYTTGLLQSLGWPQTSDHTREQRAAFRDLLDLPRGTLALHTFQFEGDVFVAPSPLVDLARDRSSEPVTLPPRAVFSDELLTFEPPIASGLGDSGRRWLDLRVARPALADLRYSGFIGPRPPAPYRVSRVDRYVDCPFKYFAESVLGLPDEREEVSGLSPLERGTLVHALFEEFYRTWQQDGRGTVTADALPEALALFGRLTDRALARLPAADRALEEARLLGSIVGRGLAERVFELEVDAGGDVVDRLLEVALEGTFAFPKTHGFDRRLIAIRGKADRIDCFRTGELRVIDYKLSRLPDLDTSLQVGVYAHVAQQVLEARDGRAHPVTQAMYLAFGDDRRTDGPVADPGTPTVAAVAVKASNFVDVVERIEAGEYPPSPRRPAECQWCSYSGVCRKEYQRDDQDAAAEPV